MKITSEAIKTALLNGNIEFFDQFQIDINYKFQEEDGDSLLLYAISNECDNNIYQALIARNADIYAINNLGENIIHSIVFSGDPSRLKYVLEKFPDLKNKLNHQDQDGTTPLLLSILIDKLSLSEQLINDGADVNIQDKDGNAPIHFACWSGYFNIVKKLVERGANILLKTSKGNLPLALAINEGHITIARYLFPLWLEINRVRTAN